MFRSYELLSHNYMTNACEDLDPEDPSRPFFINSIGGALFYEKRSLDWREFSKATGVGAVTSHFVSNFFNKTNLKDWFVVGFYTKSKLLLVFTQNHLKMQFLCLSFGVGLHFFFFRFAECSFK